MLIFKGTNNLPIIEKPVVAVGAFDGVHVGHRRILSFLLSKSKEIGGTSVVFTFEPHPRVVMKSCSDFFTINTLEENLKLIENEGIDIVIIQKFTEEFAKMTYSDFVNNIIIGELGANTLVMGPNHAVGHKHEGNIVKIKELCDGKNVKIAEIPEMMWHSAGVHSANIREAIRAKKWDEVEAMLGYEYLHKENNDII